MIHVVKFLIVTDCQLEANDRVMRILCIMVDNIKSIFGDCLKKKNILRNLKNKHVLSFKSSQW